MGVEAYELLADVARAFGVPDACRGAATFTTAGDLHRYILDKRRPRPPAACLTGAVFYRIRRGLMSALAVPRPAIRPATALEELLPTRGRRRAWRRLEAAVGLGLPGLDLPERLFWWLLLGGLLSWPLCFAAIAWRSDWLTALFWSAWPFCYPLFVLLGGVVVGQAVAPLRRRVPRGCGTLREFSRAVVAQNYGELAPERDRWDDEQVWQDLVALIAAWGISRERITKEARLVEDLGAYSL